ncbi:MAG: hypothetical protein U9R51_03020 [Actinomycetota bacterium]|nr:hypothetical protein [Actinomycetota bacterium]
MPPRIPDRYRMNVRLGADGDIEEWLATDEHLERPVLIRFPGPDADTDRIAAFLAPVRAAAATTHAHVQMIYAAGEVDGSAFAVAEWDGAVTIADRLKAGETLPITEYLTNASGLASGLAAFHANGGIHGAIDPRAIHFSAAHPARLASFGRVPLTNTAADDTAALAAALRTAITGSDNPAVLPSHVAEGIPSSVDDALEAAESGAIDATGLADALNSSSLHPQPDVERPWSLKPLVVFAFIVAAVLGLSILGLSIDVDPDSPFLYPAAPADQEHATPTSTVQASDTPTETAIPSTVSVYDPFGDGIENDDSLDALADGKRATMWETEPYPFPLDETKEGVGVILESPNPIGAIEITGTPNTRFTIAWNVTLPDVPGDWERIGAGQILTGTTRLDVAHREQGFWLVWITSLPQRSDGSYGTSIAEIRLLP